jgi:hypothetical protein
MCNSGRIVWNVVFSVVRVVLKERSRLIYLATCFERGTR